MQNNIQKNDLMAPTKENDTAKVFYKVILQLAEGSG